MGPLRDLTTKALAPKNFNDQTPMVYFLFATHFGTVLRAQEELEAHI